MGIDGINPMQPAAQQRLVDAGVDAATIGLIHNVHAEMLGMPVKDDPGSIPPGPGQDGNAGPTQPPPPMGPDGQIPGTVDPNTNTPGTTDPNGTDQIDGQQQMPAFEDGHHPDYPTMFKSQVLILQTVGVPKVTLDTWRAEGWSQFQVQEWMDDHILANPYAFDREMAAAFGVERPDGTTRAALDSLLGVLPPEKLGIETAEGPGDQPREIDTTDSEYSNLTANQVWMLRTIGYDEIYINQINAEDWATTDVEQMLREVVAYPAEFDQRMGFATGTTRQRLIDAGFEPSTVGTGQYNEQGEPTGVTTGGGADPNANGAVTGGGDNGMLKNILTGVGAVGGGLMLWRFRKGKAAGQGFMEALRGSVTHPFRSPLADTIRNNPNIGPGVSQRMSAIADDAQKAGLLGAGGLADADEATRALIQQAAEEGAMPLEGMSARAQRLMELREITGEGSRLSSIANPPGAPDMPAGNRPPAAPPHGMPDGSQGIVGGYPQGAVGGQPPPGAMPHEQTLGFAAPPVAGAPPPGGPGVPRGAFIDPRDPTGERMLIEKFDQGMGYSVDAFNLWSRVGVDAEALLHAELSSSVSDDLLRAARQAQP